MKNLTQKNKSTEELTHEIKSATDIEDYLIQNKEELQLPHLSDALHLLLSQKEISRADVVRDSLLDRAYVYQIFSGERTPSRDKLIAIAFGLHLSDTQTQTILKLSCNRELYAREERDALILFALQREMTIMEANDLLFAHGFTVLGTTKE
ncbi:MAG: helix-turn-helix domain-containing protein [Lachnospiraceae bacterium]|nr:helix-turn-helix domain-containing protein [Lachnospiraceae bacterium]